MRRASALLILTSLGGFALLAKVCRADVFLLRSGARLQGEWLNADESPIRQYVIGVDSGTRVTLRASQVAEHIRESVAIAEYRRRAPLVPDTLADQWKWSEWCREQGLKEQRADHLRRVLEFDPNHVEARRGLGFMFIDGRWVTTEDHFRQRGYVFHNGKWRLPQEADLLEERREWDKQERDWVGRLKLWREQLGTERDSEAAKNLSTIQDPAALRALRDALGKPHPRRFRLLIVHSIARIGGGLGSELLFKTALDDPDLEIFHACADKLVASQIPGLVRPITDALRDPDNRRVNRAAHLLGRLGDRTAIPALAGALVTTHQIELPNSGRTTATFEQPNGGNAPAGAANSGSGGGAGGTAFSSGRTPKTAPVVISNQEVLAALVKLSGGQSFGFDERAWMNWWASASKRR